MAYFVNKTSKDLENYNNVEGDNSIKNTCEIFLDTIIEDKNISRLCNFLL
jgi:hypothetical protein